MKMLIVIASSILLASTALAQSGWVKTFEYSFQSTQVDWFSSPVTIQEVSGPVNFMYNVVCIRSMLVKNVTGASTNEPSWHAELAYLTDPAVTDTRQIEGQFTNTQNLVAKWIYYQWNLSQTFTHYDNGIAGDSASRSTNVAVNRELDFTFEAF